MEMPSGSGETSLVRAAAAGDGPAFASLYEAYEQRIFNYLLRLLGDRHEAEDATQEAFIRVMAKLPELDADELQFGPYLYTAARNAGYDVISKRKRLEPTGPAPAEAESPYRGELSDIEVDPERSALASSQDSAVRLANERLPERQREVLALRELEGLSYDEIASVMEMKSNAVAQLISRARIGLRKEMQAGAAASVALATADCETAHLALACRQDGQGGFDADWLNAHLAGCSNCRIAGEEMAEAGVSYRAWAPVLPAAWIFREVMAKASEINGNDWSEVERPSGPGGGNPSRGSHSGSSRKAALAGSLALLLAGLFAVLLMADANAPERIKPASKTVEKPAVEMARVREKKGFGKAKKRDEPGETVIADLDQAGNPVLVPASGGPAGSSPTGPVKPDATDNSSGTGDGTGKELSRPDPVDKPVRPDPEPDEPETPVGPVPGGPTTPEPGGPTTPVPGGPTTPIPGGPTSPVPGGPIPG